MAQITSTEVTLPIAMHVLWHVGDSNLGQQPGKFVERLLMTMSAADTANMAKLTEAFPGYAEAFTAVTHTGWGLEWLRKMVKAGIA